MADVNAAASWDSQTSKERASAVFIRLMDLKRAWLAHLHVPEAQQE